MNNSTKEDLKSNRKYLLNTIKLFCVCTRKYPCTRTVAVRKYRQYRKIFPIIVEFLWKYQKRSFPVSGR